MLQRMVEIDRSKLRRGKVTPEHKMESARLRRIWDSKADLRRSKGAYSQAEFGEKFAVGNQAAVGHFLNGNTALSMKAARGFAKGLECDIAEFSPRLAKQLGNRWPFPGIEPERWETLLPDERIEIQGVVRERMEAFEARRHGGPGQKQRSAGRK